MKPEDMRKWIDTCSYETLLRKWRHAPSGDPYFEGEVGRYFSDAMARRRREVGNDEHARASKSIGWD